MLRWCYTARFLRTIFNTTMLHKISIRVTWRLPTIFNHNVLIPQHTAQLWTDFKYLQRCCNKHKKVKVYFNYIRIRSKTKLKLFLKHPWIESHTRLEFNQQNVIIIIIIIITIIMSTRSPRKFENWNYMSFKKNNRKWTAN